MGEWGNGMMEEWKGGRREQWSFGVMRKTGNLKRKELRAKCRKPSTT